MLSFHLLGFLRATPAWQLKWYTTTVFSFSDIDLCKKIMIYQLIKDECSLCTKRGSYSLSIGGVSFLFCFWVVR